MSRLSPDNHRLRHRQRGVALLLVLAGLVLLTVLVLAFLTSVGTELQSSKMYANGSTVKLLAQSSVALAVGEIRAATSDPSLCWASQPGMIRTYKNDGTANGFYKLYSDDTMAGTGAFDHTQTGLVPDGKGGTTAWYNQKGVYVDLNQPVRFNSSNFYPILDGNSADYLTTYTPPLATLTTPTATSTVNALSPVGANGLPAVNGFWLNSNTPIDVTAANVAPMPVKWLYVLKKGDVIVPDSNPVGGVVTFTKAGVKPSQDNPITGRIAFWTDDETCKVNINTASEGTFWDTPRAYSKSDYAYAINQPVQNEFQRYPGHPATVSLSAVFNGLNSTAEKTGGFPENFYPVTPRTQSGGSKGGTVSTATVAGGLSLRSTRLYSTLDDFVFQPSLNGTLGSALAPTRHLNSELVATAADLDATAIQKAGFFLTASSQAPDVNVFNLPRVSLWPITLTGASAAAATPVMTAYDRLISFCSTISTNKYYFQRWDPTSATNDLPADGTLVNAANPLARNRDVLEYLRVLTSQNIPGFGGSFSGKYGSPGDNDQILTEMFDYIRATNLQDSSSGATTFAKSYSNASPYAGGGLGQVVPIQDTAITVKDPVGGASNNPRGFGRFPSVQQACLVFIGAGNSSTPVLTPTTNPNPKSSYTPQVASGKERVQAALFLQMYDPSLGLAITRPWYQIKITNLDKLQWNGSPIFPTGATFPFVYNSTPTVRPTASDAGGQAMGASQAAGFTGISYGGIIDYRSHSILRGSASGGSSNPATTKGGYGSPIYPFVSPPTGQSTPLATAADMTSGSTFSFTTTGNVTVEVYALDASGNPSTNPIQTLSLKFPDGTFPVPVSINNDGTATATNPVKSYVPASTALTKYPYYNFLSFLDGVKSGSPPVVVDGALGTGYGRLDFASNALYISQVDTVRAIVASDPSASTSAASAGDMRLIAARQNVPDGFFQPITSGSFPATADYFGGATVRFSHFLRILTGAPIWGTLCGKLIHVSSTVAYDGYATSTATTPGQITLWSPTEPMDSTYSWGGSSKLPKDPIVVNQNSSVMVGNTGSIPGDWDNGFGNSQDGPYINKADEGDAGTIVSGAYGTNGNPYFELDYNNALPGPTFFTPNRMVPSAGMFGSLPSGVWSNKAWQTLLFRPGPANHPGLGLTANGHTYTAPPDHLYLDLFNMPVVEPFAISTPLATTGRINLNYLIVPFTYINRDTGLRAVMKSQMLASIPNAREPTYKTHLNTAGGLGGIASIRWPIDLDATLSQFLARFYNKTGSGGANGAPDIFHSASEICNIDLVPADTSPGMPSYLGIPVTRTNMDNYWSKNALTGDNSRERPYANIYPLLTTKSNTYTIHYRVQTLKQVLPGTAAVWQTWREGTDLVQAEARGSQTIERYVDPNATVPDYPTLLSISNPTPPAGKELAQFYKFRVVSSKQFPP